MLHRVRQFRDAGVEPTAPDYALGDAYLAGPLRELFVAQHPRDIVHAARTAQWLLDRGFDERELIAAALLHDIGKGEQRRRDRVAWVLAEGLKLGRVAASAESGLEVRRALARTAEHSESGARALLAAGATPRVVTLTRLHHSPPRGDRMLALLQRADAAN